MGAVISSTGVWSVCGFTGTAGFIVNHLRGKESPEFVTDFSPEAEPCDNSSLRGRVVMAGDSVLQAKWRTRAEEWRRLAEQARDAHVAIVCDKMAEQAETMEKFWSR